VSTRREATRSAASAKANGISDPSHEAFRSSQASRRNATVLSPTIERELGDALERAQGSHKAAAVAFKLGVDRSTYFRRHEDPLSLNWRETLALLDADPDPRLNARIRGHLAAIDAYQAIAEHEAGESYLRIRALATGQRTLFGGDR